MSFEPTEMTFLIRVQPDVAKVRIMESLRATAGHLEKAAAMFRVSRATLGRWIHKLELEDDLLALRGHPSVAQPAPTPAEGEELLHGPNPTPVPAESPEPAARGDSAGTARTPRSGINTTIVLDAKSEALLKALEAELGQARSAVVRTAIRELARREGLLVPGKVAG